MLMPLKSQAPATVYAPRVAVNAAEAPTTEGQRQAAVGMSRNP